MEQTLNGRMRRWTALLAALIVLGNVVVVLTTVWAETDVRGVESNVVYTLQRILAGNEHLYTDPAALPFAITQYTPLYYLLADGLLSALGIAPADYRAVRTASRLLSVFLLLLTLYVFYRLLRTQLDLDREAGLLLTLLAFAFPVPWYALTRPDVLVAFCLIASLSGMLAYVRTGRALPLLGAGLASFLAVFAKQNGILLPALFVPFLLFYRDVRGLAVYLAGVLGGAVAGVLWFVLAGYGGEFVLANIVDGPDNGLHFRKTLVKAYGNFAVTFAVFVVGSVPVLGWLVGRLRRDDRPLVLLAAACVLQFAFAAATAFKAGSAMNYFNEGLLVLLLLWGCYLKRFDFAAYRFPVRFYLLYFLLACGVAVTAAHVHRYFPSNLDAIVAQRQGDPDLDAIEALLDRAPGDVYFYTEIRALNLRLPDRATMPQHEIVICCAYPRGVFDYTGLCRQFRDGRIRFIVTRDADLPPDLYGCRVDDVFSPHATFGPYRVFARADAVE